MVSRRGPHKTTYTVSSIDVAEVSSSKPCWRIPTVMSSLSARNTCLNSSYGLQMLQFSEL